MCYYLRVERVLPFSLWEDIFLKNNRLIIAITPYGTKVVGTVMEVCREYDINYRTLMKLIETGGLFRDHKTCFDEVYIYNGKK